MKALVDALTDRILSGDLAPGSPLREVQVAEEYQVGRHTVRAALQHLALERLLRHEPNRGARVPRLTVDDVRDFYLCRGLLEESIVRHLTERRITPSEAERALADFEALPEDAGWRVVVEADLRVHQALASAVGSRRLDRMYQSLSAELRLCVAQLRPFYSSPAELAAEHREILDAIASRDAKRAVAVMRAHLQRAVDDLAGGEMVAGGERRS